MKVCKVLFPDAKLECEAFVALSEQEQQVGLMKRRAPLPSMVFPYACAGVQKFWMKNTQAPLDILFCLDGKITSICRGEPYSTALIGNDSLSDLVIELPAGTCKKYEIKAGQSASIMYDKETAMEIFALKNNIRY